ncbi:restriction endonuclease subunit S [Streptomyces oceani]|uniref:restriction endonuclease subunit S n=1 Tax=Streptomyces oceani TaxID=1075402 RepID=UPI0009A11EE9|nr:restriction endonuclease subunit S [Streptomyces oceani]
MSDDGRFIPFSDLVEVNPSGDFVSGLAPYISMGDVTNYGYLSQVQYRLVDETISGNPRFRNKDTLFAKITPCMENGKGAFVEGLKEGVGIGSTEFHVLRAKPGVAPRFIYHWTRSREFRLKAEAMMTGSAGQRRVPSSFFGKFMVAGLSLDEQQRIADVIDAVSEQERSINVEILKLERMRYGLVARAFRDGEKIIETGASESTEWELRSIGELCRVSSGITPSRSSESRYFAQAGTPWVKTLDLNEGWVSTTEEALTEVAMSDLGIRRYAPQSVLVAMYGGWQQIGRTAILDVPAAVNQAISVLEACTDIYPEYLLLALQCNRYKWRQFAASTRKDPNITKSDVLQFEIGVPSREEQERIVDVDHAVRQDIANGRNQLEKMRKFKLGLIDALLGGGRCVG